MTRMCLNYKINGILLSKTPIKLIYLGDTDDRLTTKICWQRVMWQWSQYNLYFIMLVAPLQSIPRIGAKQSSFKVISTVKNSCSFCWQRDMDKIVLVHLVTVVYNAGGATSRIGAKQSSFKVIANTYHKWSKTSDAVKVLSIFFFVLTAFFLPLTEYMWTSTSTTRL